MRSQRLAGLDGIRGLAALFVVVNHVFLRPFPGSPVDHAPFWSGWFIFVVTLALVLPLTIVFARIFASVFEIPFLQNLNSSVAARPPLTRAEAAPG